MTDVADISRILTLVFTDLADSTALKTQRGDQAVGELIRRPALKNQLAKVLLWAGPRFLGDGPTHQTGLGVVLAIDENGQVRKRYLDPTDVVGAGITTAVPHGNFLWIASLSGYGAARCAR